MEDGEAAFAILYPQSSILALPSRKVPRSQVALGNAPVLAVGLPRPLGTLLETQGDKARAVRLRRSRLPFPSATWERGDGIRESNDLNGSRFELASSNIRICLKLVRCPRSLAATLAALPSMSPIPSAPFGFRVSIFGFPPKGFGFRV